MSLPLFTAFILQLLGLTQAYYDNNLSYLSPVNSSFKYAIDPTAVHLRMVNKQAAYAAKRDLRLAIFYRDGHYPYYAGGNYSRDFFVQGGGIKFTHHVASGDPWDTSVILWTRAAPSHPDNISDRVPVCVKWEVAQDPNFWSVVSRGEAFTSSDVDWTVKVEAKGLQPDSHYSYRFLDCANSSTVSPVGKTRTLASPDTPAERVNGGKPLNIGVFSCANYPQGYFNAYNYAVKKLPADKTLDLFVHLGDYTYEFGGGGKKIGRYVPGKEEATLSDYRNHMALYRTDEGLANAHMAGPWITVWDDHDVADNSWKGGSHDSNNTKPCSFGKDHLCFSDRKKNAIRAYHEWLPIRQVDGDDKLRIWRSFRIGKLIDLVMLDTRQYDRDITDIYTNRDEIAKIADNKDRTIMGDKQEKWFLDTLSASKQRGTVWRMIGQQVIFSSIISRGRHNLDAWDGYTANRAQILNYIKSQKISNAVILSGDSHANWVSDLIFPGDKKYDPVTGKNALGVEFAVTAVSSPGCCNKTKDASDLAKQRVTDNPELQWNENFYRGFYMLAVDEKNVKATFYAMNDTKTKNLDGFEIAEFIVKAGENRVHRPVGGGHVKEGYLKPVPKSTRKAKMKAETAKKSG